MQSITVIKIGGNVIDKQEALAQLIQKFVRIEGYKLLVHGGGVLANEMLDKAGIPVQMHEGRRITDLETLKMCTMVYAGWLNKTITAQLNEAGCPAVGLSGVDANIVPATKRAPNPVDFGYVGDVEVERINTKFLHTLFEQGLCPVMCAISHNTQGGLLNTNADTMASAIAVALAQSAPTSLVYCFEKNGVLMDMNDDASVISILTPTHYKQLKDQHIINKGMIPKLDNAFLALEKGVREVHIKHANHLLEKAIGTLLKT
ncbi:acetylglutamate kinase [Bacteroidia bacterium]|nr:acetylglutamate kinase [Bacteroidia bacterium]